MANDRIRVRIESSNNPKGFLEFDRHIDKSRREVEGFFNQLKRGVGIDFGGQIARGLRSIPRAIQQAFADGIDLKVAEERARNSIAAIIKSFSDISLDDAFALSTKTLADLRKASETVASDFAALQDVYSGNIASFFGAGITNIKEQIRLTAVLADAVKTVVGPDPNQQRTEIRGLLTGQINNTTLLAKNLGITSEDISGAKEAGTLVEFLTVKLEAFNEVAARASGGYETAVSNLNAQLDSLKKELATPLFEELSNAAKEFKAALEDGDLKSELGDIGEKVASVADSAKDLLLWVLKNSDALLVMARAARDIGVALALWKLKNVALGIAAATRGWLAKTAAVRANTQALQANAAAGGAAGAAGAGGRFAGAGRVAIGIAGATLIGVEIGRVIKDYLENTKTGQQFFKDLQQVFFGTDHRSNDLVDQINKNLPGLMKNVGTEAGRELAEQFIAESIVALETKLGRVDEQTQTLFENMIKILEGKLRDMPALQADVELKLKTENAKKSLEELMTALDFDDALLEIATVRGDLEFEEALKKRIENARTRAAEAFESFGVAVSAGDSAELAAAVEQVELSIEQRKELITLVRDLVLLERELSDTREEAAQKARDLAEDTKERLEEGAKAVEQEIAAGAERAAAVQDRRRDFADELSVLQARAAGNDRLAEQLDQQRRTRLETLRIQRDLQVSEEEALRLAEAKIAAEVALRQEKDSTRRAGANALDPISGRFDDGLRNGRFSPLGESEGFTALGKRGFPGLERLAKMQEKPLRDSFRFPGLDALAAMNAPAKVDIEQPGAGALPQLRGTDVPNKSGEELRALRGTFERLTKALEEADSTNAETIGEIHDMTKEALEKSDRALEQIRNGRD